MTQYGFYFDNSRCSGCKTCMMACKDYNDLDADLTYRRVYDYEGGAWQEAEQETWVQEVFSYHVSFSCAHCSEAVCLMVCPTGAMHRAEGGLVRTNSRVCIGCGYCTLACPYDAPRVSDVTHTSTKCDGCYSRVLEGASPICVEACPLRALDFDDIEVLREKYEGNAGIAPLPDPSFTNPNIVIKPSVAARPCGDSAGFIANEKETR
ncbi:MAG: 4Fe-4S binding protein [Eggerthellaceae bacterium]|jgi:anaerobic dimethyl sulfoxide reductase subunit B (iron-sulfur subunit)|nr:4Fe-4S binding protein [Eggerthellaceae bacterium]MDR2721864.1 4Fe-4S binding protein [Coriobacteriaceae bacterium]